MLSLKKIFQKCITNVFFHPSKYIATQFYVRKSLLRFAEGKTKTYFK